MTDVESLARLVDERWPHVRRALNYPVVDRVRVVRADDGEGEAGDIDASAGDESGRDAGDGGRDQGAYRWERNEITIPASYLRLLDPDPADAQRVVDAVLEREVGHYVYFPRELAHHLQYLQRATEAFDAARGKAVYTVYADVCADLRLLESGVAGGELLDLRRHMLNAITADGPGSIAVEAYRRVERLVAALYGTVFKDLDAPVTLTDDEREYLKHLREIPYFADSVAAHERNLVRFGHVLEDATDDLPGSLAGERPEDAGGGTVGRAFPTDLDALSRADVDDALSAAVEQGKWEYDRLAEFLDTETGFADRFEARAAGGAGLERSAIKTHDDEIPFYRRWAASHPLYVAQTPVETDELAQYRGDRTPYEVSDPLEDVDPFASMGLVGVPGISQVYEYEPGWTDVSEVRVPDLLVGLDSSGSMPPPGEESHAVLAAFVLANAYHRHGAHVGGYNFSADLAYLPPTRDRQQFYSLACARWGGGTALNWDALLAFLDEPNDDEVRTTDADDHEQLLADLQDGAGDERTSASTAGESADGDRPDVLTNLDHVLVTDGDVANRGAVVDAVERAAADARHFVFLTDEDAAEEWRALDAPNTRVHAVSESADLVDLAVGRSQSIATRPTTD